MLNLRKFLIYSLLSISGSNVMTNLREIKRVSQLDFYDAKRYQDEKLRKLLYYCFKNIPYYRNIIGRTRLLKNNSINLQYFTDLPFLTKEIIRSQGRKLISREKRLGLYENYTGGSTGEPLHFWQDKYYHNWNVANKIFYKTLAGQEIGEKELRFWGSERDLLKDQESLKIRLINLLYNRRQFNTFKMSPADMLSYVKSWNEYNPHWVEAYVQAMYELARFVEKKRLPIKTPKHGILTSAGNLYPEMKKKIEEIFRCPVYNRYGCREVGDIAFGRDQLQISFWNQKVEVINGQIYVTNLNNYTMPFVRYKIGDLAKPGRNEFVLDKIIGRELNVFKTKSGRLISGVFFAHFLGVVYNQGGIKKFQVIQKDYDHIVIKTVVGNKKSFNSQKNNIEQVIRKEMDNQCRIEWKFVKDIPTTSDGKYLYTIREMK